MKTLMTTAIWVLALAFLFVTAVAMFDRLLIQSDSEFIDSASGAFFGALFGFLAARFGDVIGRLGRREAEHHSALVRYEHYFNDVMNDVSDLVFVIDDFSEKFREMKMPLTVWSNRLRPIPIEVSPMAKLRNLDFMNEILSFNVDLRKLNSSMETLNRAYDRAEQALIENRIDAQSYWANIEHFKRGLAELRQFAVATLEEMKDLLAKVRVLAKDRPIMMRVYRGTRRLHYSKNQIRSFHAERAKLDSEVAQTEQASAARIERVKATPARS